MQVYGFVSRVKYRLAERNLQGHGGRPGLSNVCRADGHLGLDLGFRTRCLSNFGEYGLPIRLPHRTNDTSSWAISCWAPFAFLGVEINRLSSTASYVPLGRNSIDLDSPSTLHLQQPESEQQSTGEGSGKYLGIMNVYTTLPQFVGTGISFVVFSLLEPGKSPELSDAPEHEHHSTDGVNAISVCLFIGAMCAVVAGFTTAKLGRIAKY